MTSVIIVNYNTTELVENCIRSVYQYCDPAQFDIWVVDNASADRSIELLTQKFPAVQLILNPVNQGFGAANNLAIAKAKGKYIFLLNPDTQLLSDAISAFTQFMEDPANVSVGVCGGELLTGTERPANSFGNFPSLLYSFSSIGFSYLYRNYYRKHIDVGVANYDPHIKRVDFISGAAMFIRASVLKTVGIFDPAFFLYFEETELSWRIHRAGYQSVLIPSVKILHLEGASTSETSGSFNYFAYHHYHHSRRIFYRKAYGPLYAFLARPLDVMATIVKTVVGREGGSLCRKLFIEKGLGVRV